MLLADEYMILATCTSRSKNCASKCNSVLQCGITVRHRPPEGHGRAVDDVCRPFVICFLIRITIQERCFTAMHVHMCTAKQLRRCANAPVHTCASTRANKQTYTHSYMSTDTQELDNQHHGNICSHAFLRERDGLCSVLPHCNDACACEWNQKPYRRLVRDSTYLWTAQSRDADGTRASCHDSLRRMTDGVPNCSCNGWPLRVHELNAIP